MDSKKIKFMLSDADRNLFTRIHNSYLSDAEKKFFMKMKHKEQYDSAYSNELLVYEKENADGLYLIRKYFDTYLIGYSNSNGDVEEYECATLAAALSLRLDVSVGYPDKSTLGEWLRKTNYKFVKYNRNYDDD